MALSDYEKQILAEMEQHLRQQDPELADTMASSLPQVEEPEAAPPVRSLSPRRIALGSILAVVGLAIVLVGVTVAVAGWTIVLGAVGFLAMVGGVLLALSTDGDGGAGTSRSSSPSDGATPQATKASREQREAERRERWKNRR